MAGISAFSGYLPWRRLSRSAILASHKWLNPGLGALARGTRAMASWDEDTITLAVEAARSALIGTDRGTIDAVTLASTTHPFADRQNAGVVCGALLLRQDVATADMGGSLRAGTTAILNAFNAIQAGASGNSLVCAADRRKAPAASSQEMQFGDAGVALVLSTDDGLARYLGGGSLSVDFVDHYREQGRDHDYQWEERWVRDEGVKKQVPAAIKATLNRLGIAPSDIRHFIFPSTFKGADAEIAALSGLAKDTIRPNLGDAIGDTGTAHPLLMLAHALEEARPGEKILVAAFGQGCDVLVFEATDALTGHRPVAPLIGQFARGKTEDNYMRFLVFNDAISWDKGKRAERDKQTSLTTQYRKRDMLTALVGGECRNCGTRQFPRTRICVNPNCRATDTQDPYGFAEQSATVISWSGDHLVFTPDPPLHYGMVEFQEGGRFLVEFTDCEPGEIGIGAPVRMAFRVKDYDSIRGFRRYFWKAVPDRNSNAHQGGR